MKLDPNKLPIKIRQARRARLPAYLLVVGLGVSAIIIGGWLGVASGIFALAILVLVELKRSVNAIHIDSKKITLCTGLFSAHTTTVYYQEITDIKISQNVWERLIDTGTIYVNTPGHGEYELMEKKLPNPHRLRNFIEDLKHGTTLQA